MEATGGKLMAVWTITERGGRLYRTRIGVACEAPDGTLTARLDALPIGGQLTIGPWAPAEPAAPPRAGEVRP